MNLQYSASCNHPVAVNCGSSGFPIKTSVNSSHQETFPYPVDQVQKKNG